MRFQIGDIVKLHKDYDYEEFEDHRYKGIEGKIFGFTGDEECPVNIIWDNESELAEFIYGENELRLVRRTT